MSVRVDPPPGLIALVERLRATPATPEEAPRRRKQVVTTEDTPIDPRELQRVTDEIAEAAVAEYNRQNGQRRFTIGLLTEQRCVRHEIVDVHSEDFDSPSRLERLEIPDYLAESFWIHEIALGGFIQYPRHDGRRHFNRRRVPLLGTVFARSSAIQRPITFDVVRIGRPVLSLRIEYRGDNPKGESFIATGHFLARDADAGVKYNPLARGA